MINKILSNVIMIDNKMQWYFTLMSTAFTAKTPSVLVKVCAEVKKTKAVNFFYKKGGEWHEPSNAAIVSETYYNKYLNKIFKKNVIIQIQI